MSDNIIEINSLDDERIKFFRSMRDNLLDDDKLPLFVAEGDKVVLKLFKSCLMIHSILAARDFYTKNSFLIPKSVNIIKMTAGDELLKKIIGFRMHTGVMALAFKPERIGINELSGNIVCLNGIVDSENVGSIVRNCTAFGIDSLICDNSTSSPYLRRAVRVSMGTIFGIKTFISDNITPDLVYLRKSGYKIISAEINKDSIPINKISFPEKSVIVFGNEAHGISEEILRISDYTVHIPINREIESLNVASASAIILSGFKI